MYTVNALNKNSCDSSKVAFCSDFAVLGLFGYSCEQEQKGVNEEDEDVRDLTGGSSTPFLF